MIDYEKINEVLYQLTHSPEIEQKINKKILQFRRFFYSKGCESIWWNKIPILTSPLIPTNE